MKFTVSFLTALFASMAMAAPAADFESLAQDVKRQVIGIIPPAGCANGVEFIRCATKSPLGSIFCTYPGAPSTTCLGLCKGCCNGRNDPDCADAW